MINLIKPDTRPILFLSGFDAQKCAERLRRIGRHPHARHTTRLIDGQCHHVVLLIGEKIMLESDI